MTRDEALDSLIDDSEKKIEELRKNLESEEKFLNILRERRGQESNGDVGVVAATEIVAGSVAALITEVFQTSDGPMRAVEVATKVFELGKLKGHQASVTNNVYVTLKRRTDIFERIDRGLYKLRKREPKTPTPAG